MSHAQTWDPQRYERNAGFVSVLGGPVVELLDPQPGERILDLGCGDGRLTEQLVAAGCEVVGVDGSAQQVAAARGRGLEARVADARSLPFEREFDAVFTNATLHWVKPPEAAVASVARALRPAGRFVGEFGGRGNVAAVRRGLYAALAERGLDGPAIDPWYFPAPDEYGELLTTHGFEVESIALIPRPTPVPTDVICWLETFGETFTNTLPEPERRPFLEEVRDSLRGDLEGPDGWSIDYVRLRFRAKLRAT
jgi:SAM-dependent methyltransferase